MIGPASCIDSLPMRRMGTRRVVSAAAALLLVVAAAASMATLCDAQLPTSVVSGYTVCNNMVECNVAGGGTTLAVVTMTADAKTAGNATATFKTQGTTFTGKLVIDCLTSDPWADGVSLTVEIRDGAHAAVIPTVIEITGALSLGSSILIINGTYDFNVAFIVLTSFGLEDHSTLVVTGMQFGHTTMPESVLKSTQSLSIANSSRLEVSYTSHTFTSMTVGSDWAWYLIDSASSLDIATNSSVAVIGNSNTLSSITAPSCHIGAVRVGALPLTVSGDASLKIDGNKDRLDSVTASTGPLTVRALTHTATTNVTAGGSVQVTGNGATLVSVTAGGVLTLAPIDALGLSLDNATVTASRNAYSVSIVTAASLALAYLRATDINATNGAAVAVEGNSFTRSELTGTVAPPESSIAFVGSSGTIRVSDAARLHITGNTVAEGPAPSSTFSNLRLLVAGALVQAGGMVRADRNAVVFSTTPDTLFTLTTTSAAINVCMNYVNHLQCTGMPGGNYSCAQTGAAGVNFVLCSATVTKTPRTMTRTPLTTTTTTTTTTTAAPGSGSSSGSSTTTTAAGSSSTTTTAASSSSTTATTASSSSTTATTGGSSTTSTTSTGGSTTTTGGSSNTTSTVAPGSSSVGAYTSVVGAAIAVVGGCIMMLAL